MASGSPPDFRRRRQIAALRAKGLSVLEIGRRFGITHQCVSQALRRIAKPLLRLPCSRCGGVIESAGLLPRDEGNVLCLDCVDLDPGATFGQRLRAFRLAAGLTKAELARRAGIFATGVQGYEAGRQYPADGSREQLANALGIIVARLGVGSDRPAQVGRGRPRKNKRGRK
jgi:transcriptional regulator with XRE-family HTH domain